MVSGEMSPSRDSVFTCRNVTVLVALLVLVIWYLSKLRHSPWVYLKETPLWWYLLTVSRKRNQNEFAWKKTKKLTTHLILALMCFLFFQANLILVPFPTHRQQVPSLYFFIFSDFVTIATILGTGILGKYNCKATNLTHSSYRYFQGRIDRFNGNNENRLIASFS